ncbi:MAG TPA: M13 family metallopeptidase [Candidatus Angelobacter sp.]|nr:M13 family metallopeptidase [Candidatus Angelobacter sp.]
MTKQFCHACLALLVLITYAPAQQKPASSTEPALPYSPSLDVSSMDKSVDPCVDFYQYSCGGWQKKNPIPADQTSWGVYGKLYQDNLAFLRGILEQAASAKGKRDTVTQEIGDFYSACMDEAGIEKLGAGALKPQLAMIDQVKSAHDLAPVVASMQLELGGVLFGSGVRQAPDNSEQQIIGVTQGGLGLPDRDYYTKDDPKSKEIRERYLQHVQKIFELLGDNAETAKQNADAVMKIETALATASMTRVERRDPYKSKNKIKLADLEQMVPDFDWAAYFRTLKTRQFEIINVAPTSFFKELDTLLKDEPVANLRNYLRYHLANGYSPYLSSAFVQENFDFFISFLRGAKEMQPRWKRCVQFTDRDLGEALGQAYVRKVFSPELKASTLDMVRRIEDAMAQRIQQLDWMSPETKEQALAKLHGIRNKIGYPDKWRDYSSVKITSNDFLGDVERLTEFERHRNLNKLGQPVDHGEWGMSPPTVNAYYNPAMNDINFPAGVLQPPLYDAKIDDAPNYGDTGGTIGHELTHGFDDQGAKFDAKGNLRDWWTKEDKEKFEERTKCIADQYAQYVVVDDVHINSRLTLGEDVADLGGEILAYIAWKSATKDKKLQTVDDLTPEQRFFIGFAQWDCSNDRPENLRLRAMTDPHSPSKYRINGVVVNMPEFAKAFSCKAGQPMVNPPDKVCKVW